MGKAVGDCVGDAVGKLVIMDERDETVTVAVGGSSLVVNVEPAIVDDAVMRGGSSTVGDADGDSDGTPVDLQGSAEDSMMSLHITTCSGRRPLSDTFLLYTLHQYSPE